MAKTPRGTKSVYKDSNTDANSRGTIRAVCICESFVPSDQPLLALPSFLPPSRARSSCYRGSRVYSNIDDNGIRVDFVVY